MTRVAADKRLKLISKYNDYLSKYNMYCEGGNSPMAEMFKQRMKTIRMTLELLDIHIEGINRFIHKV